MSSGAPSRAARADLSRRGPGDEERAAQVHADDPVERLDVHLGNRRERHDPGRVHHDVEAAERRGGRVEQRLDVVGLADVPADGDDTAARARDPLGHLLRTLLGTIAGRASRPGWRGRCSR
jgi:hypothetical protein